MKAANREQKNVHHDEENPVNWGKEEVDSWLQLMWPQLTPRNPVSQLSGWQLLRLTRHKCGLCSAELLLDIGEIKRHLRKEHRGKGIEEYSRTFLADTKSDHQSKTPLE